MTCTERTGEGNGEDNMSKRLVLMHGAPASGKSTFIRELGLEYLSVSPDNIRLLFSEPELMEVDHHLCLQISQKNNKKVWNLAFQLLEERLQNGSDTFFDACNFTQDYIHRYKKMAGPYGFQIMALDFSSIPLDTLLARNKRRLYFFDGLRYVPEQVIKDIYQKMEPIPKGIFTIDATQPDAQDRFMELWQ